MKRGEKEACCFRIVKRAMFARQDGLPTINPITGNNFADASEAEFMKDYPDIALAMKEEKYCDWINGTSNGDFQDNEYQRCYRLSRDKQFQIKNFQSNIVVYINPSK